MEVRAAHAALYHRLLAGRPAPLPGCGGCGGWPQSAALRVTGAALLARGQADPALVHALLAAGLLRLPAGAPGRGAVVAPRAVFWLAAPCDFAAAAVPRPHQRGWWWGRRWHGARAPAVLPADAARVRRLFLDPAVVIARAAHPLTADNP